jgi:DNA-binding transcriptional MerR regulator
VEIPNRLYFRIGDVSRLTGIKPYVLRYWETEFHGLSPKKSGTNQRLYRRKEVEMVLKIKHLLYEKRFTIEGARAYLHALKTTPPRPPAPAPAGQGQLFGPAPGQMDPAEIEKVKRGLAEAKQELRAVLILLG